jgi:penicillin-binding protein 1C
LARAGNPTALETTLDGSVAADADVGAAPDDPDWAYVTDVLSDPIARAPAFGTNSILSLPFPVAVKTGTSSDFRDTWTAGFTRDYTVAVWVGNFDGHAMRGVSGVTGAAPLWNRIMLHLYDSHDARGFDPPRGYARRAICATTGLRPTIGCPGIVLEWLDRADRARLSRTGAAPAPDVTYDSWLLSQPMRANVPTRILFPRDGDRFVADPSSRLAVEVAGAPGARVTLDGRDVRGEAGVFPVPVTSGRHVLVARSAGGMSRVRYSAEPHVRGGRSGFSVLPSARETP